MLGIAEHLQATSQHRIVRGLAGVTCDRLELSGPVDCDHHIDLLRWPACEARSELGVEEYRDVTRYGPCCDRQVWLAAADRAVAVAWQRSG